jgi:hypothetical protein
MTTTEITLTNILSEQEICERFNVTSEEIGKASRILNTTTGEVYYQVESRSGGEAHGVHYNREFKRLTCTCKAGRVGVPCWAKRAAMAASLEYLQEQRIANAREQAEQERALAAKRDAEQAEARAKYAKLEAQRAAARASITGLKAGKGVRQSTPFSLLK